MPARSERPPAGLAGRAELHHGLPRHRASVDLDPVEPGAGRRAAASHQIREPDSLDPRQIGGRYRVALDHCLDVQFAPPHLPDGELVLAPRLRSAVGLLADQPRRLADAQDQVQPPEAGLPGPPADPGPRHGEIHQRLAAGEADGPGRLGLAAPDVVGVIGRPRVVTLFQPPGPWPQQREHQVRVRDVVLSDRQRRRRLGPVLTEEQRCRLRRPARGDDRRDANHRPEHSDRHGSSCTCAGGPRRGAAPSGGTAEHSASQNGVCTMEFVLTRRRACDRVEPRPGRAAPARVI